MNAVLHIELLISTTIICKHEKRKGIFINHNKPMSIG